MKKLLLFPLLFFISNNVSSQQTNNSAHWEVGINATSVLSRIFSDQPTSSSLINFRRFNSKGNAFKIGLDGNYSYQDSQNNFSSYYTNISSSFAYEFHKQLVQKWSYYYGPSLGFTYSKNSNSFNANLQKIETQSYAITTGFDLGIRYNLNNRINLGTSTSLRARFVQNESQITGQTPGEPNESYNLGIGVIAPVNIYLNVKFYKKAVD